MTEQEVENTLRTAQATAEMMYAYSRKKNDPDGSEQRRRSMC
jgi:hypothetical protein